MKLDELLHGKLVLGGDPGCAEVASDLGLVCLDCDFVVFEILDGFV